MISKNEFWKSPLKKSFNKMDNVVVVSPVDAVVAGPLEMKRAFTAGDK